MGLKSCLLTHTHILNTVTTTLIMSWQSYVDDQLISTKMIKNAVIAGHDGNIWAHSAGFPVSVEELKTLLTRYANTDELAMNGVTIGGTKYMFLSATDRVVRGKKGTSGVHCIKTVQGESLWSGLSHHRDDDLEQSQPDIIRYHRTLVLKRVDCSQH